MERHGLVQVPWGLQQHGKVVDAEGDWIFVAELLKHAVECFAIERLGFIQVSSVLQQRCKIVETAERAWMFVVSRCHRD